MRRHLHRSHRLLAALVALLLILPLVPARPAAGAATVPLTVTITSFVELDWPEISGDQYCGDYYAVVTIDGVKLDPSDVVDGNGDACANTPSSSNYTIYPNWRFTRNVDLTRTVAVKIEIFDDDLAFDDKMDISPVVGETALNLMVHPAPAFGVWTLLLSLLAFHANLRKLRSQSDPNRRQRSELG